MCIYGAGKVGKRAYEKLTDFEKKNYQGFIDQKKGNSICENYPVFFVDERE